MQQLLTMSYPSFVIGTKKDIVVLNKGHKAGITASVMIDSVHPTGHNTGFTAGMMINSGVCPTGHNTGGTAGTTSETVARTIPQDTIRRSQQAHLR
jgi:hypothetical protein